MDQLYWDTHACVQSPRGRPAVPGDSRLGSECLRGRPAVPGHSCFGLRATVWTWFSGRLGPCPRARLSNSCPVRFALLSEGPWGQPAVPATRACVREPAGSTTCSGRLRPVPEGLQGRPTLPGISVSGPGSRVDQLSRANRARVCVPVESTRLQGDSGPGLMVRGVKSQSRATPAWPRGPAVSTSCPGVLGPVPKGPRGRPVVPGDSGPCRRARGCKQPSWASQARARGPAVSSHCPGRLGPCPRPGCRPDVPGDPDPC